MIPCIQSEQRKGRRHVIIAVETKVPDAKKKIIGLAIQSTACSSKVGRDNKQYLYRLCLEAFSCFILCFAGDYFPLGCTHAY